MKQRQFLDVVERDEAARRWARVIDATTRSAQRIPLAKALDRVLAEDVRAEVDVPGFDRANMDGFSVRAEDTFGASEQTPVRLRLSGESIPTGVSPCVEVVNGSATPIATGGMLPRGADAVVPVEVTDLVDDGAAVEIRRASVPGAALSFAGTDIGRGETVLFAGTKLGSRETGVLAAIGRAEILVVRQPVVAVISTGDELVQPGAALPAGGVYDSNGRILADAVAEQGGEARFLGAVPDDAAALRAVLQRALAESDLVLLSGGTSKGEGDLNAALVAELDPGIIVHGVALKPGKPICLAARADTPVVVLPGFPTSAIFTFHEFVAGVIRSMAGLRAAPTETLSARLAVDVNSERGRLEYLLVGLVDAPPDRSPGLSHAVPRLAAYPMGKGSGSVTAFSRADGFIRIDRNTERLDSGHPVEVTRIGGAAGAADLVVIGSHCVGLDCIAAALGREAFSVKVLAVGSRGGLAAAVRGECDLAPIHLLDPETDRYNEPFLGAGLRLLPGYGRMQGVVTRPDEARETPELLEDPRLRMVNRNRGSGTRVLIDALLADRRPPGFAHEPRSHFAVAAAVAQKRADWGVTTWAVARGAGLRFRSLRAERYDFAVPEDRWDRPALVALRRLLEPGSPLRAELEALGFSSQ